MSSDILVRAYSMPRPFPGAVLAGAAPLELLELEEVPTPSDGLLVVLHAREAWEEEAAELLGVDKLEHPTGLVGCGLVRRFSWPAAGGAWVAELEDVVTFSRPAPMPHGWAGLFELPEALADRIRSAWLGRPR